MAGSEEARRLPQTELHPHRGEGAHRDPHGGRGFESEERLNLRVEREELAEAHVVDGSGREFGVDPSQVVAQPCGVVALGLELEEAPLDAFALVRERREPAEREGIESRSSRVDLHREALVLLGEAARARDALDP